MMKLVRIKLINWLISIKYIFNHKLIIEHFRIINPVMAKCIQKKLEHLIEHSEFEKYFSNTEKIRYDTGKIN